MKTIPYWLDMPYAPRDPLMNDIETDVVIIGGGITGVSAAYHCTMAGLKTVLIEKDMVASGSAGRNGGMVVDGLAIDFSEAVEKFGSDDARDLWGNTVAARNHVTDLIAKHQIECDFSQPGSLYIGRTDDDAKILNNEATARKFAGFECEIIKRGTQLKPSPFSDMVFNASDCMLHPVKFIRALATIAQEHGAIIFEKTEAIKFNTHSVTTTNGTISARHIILAMESLDPYITDHDATIIRSQAIVTEPLSDEKIKSLDWNYGGMFWTVDDGYVSARRIGNRIFCCKSLAINPTELQINENKQWQIEKLLSLFPTLTHDDLVISHQWSGLMVDPKNSRPFIRDKDGMIEICGHAGNGLTHGILCGKLAADSLKGIKIPNIYRQ